METGHLLETFSLCLLKKFTSQKVTFQGSRSLLAGHGCGTSTNTLLVYFVFSEKINLVLITFSLIVFCCLPIWLDQVDGAGGHVALVDRLRSLSMRGKRSYHMEKGSKGIEVGKYCYP